MLPANTLGRVARRRACTMVAAGTEERKFLVRNDRNDVELLQCPNPQMVGQGLLELGGLPHICVAGESNAGKSSLINHLLKKSLARASSVAGKTRSVDMMRVNSGLVVTDLPGLPSRDHQVAHLWDSIWEPLVFDYIRQCDELLAMVYAHDIRWKVSPRVRDFLHDVQAAGVPVLLVLTKDDRLITEIPQERLQGDSSALHFHRLKYTRRVRAAMDFDGVHVHYSTDSSLPTSRAGRRAVLRHIESFVEAGSREAVGALLDATACKMQRQLEHVESE